MEGIATLDLVARPSVTAMQLRCLCLTPLLKGFKLKLPPYSTAMARDGVISAVPDEDPPIAADKRPGHDESLYLMGALAGMQGCTWTNTGDIAVKCVNATMLNGGRRLRRKCVLV